MKPVDYEILRQFVRYHGVKWTVRALADFLGEPHRKIAGRFRVLAQEALIYQPNPAKQCYVITDTGREALDNAKQSPFTGADPTAWIARARSGMNSQGDPLNLKGRAVIPKPQKHPLSYEMDMEAYLDAKRAGDLDE